MSKVSDERTRLTANWLNAMAAGATVTGGVAPAVAAYFQVPGPAQAGLASLFIGSGIWLFAGLGLHLLARAFLRNLDP
jgi:hypothetical protein